MLSRGSTVDTTGILHDLHYPPQKSAGAGQDWEVDIQKDYLANSPWLDVGESYVQAPMMLVTCTFFAVSRTWEYSTPSMFLAMYFHS